MRALVLACALMALAGAVRAQPAANQPTDDPFRWLEDADSPRALAWVQAEDAKTRGVLEADPRYAGLHAQALAIAQAKDRIPAPQFVGGAVFNFWQDAEHAHGVWRRTGLAEYRKPDPAWTIVLDLDALSKAETTNWVWKGADCEPPAQRLCLVSLSDGGEDAVAVREFDVARGRFVDGGFVSSKAKQDVAWQDDDHVLLSRDWGPGTLTGAGYPFVVKRWTRGQPLAQAQEVFRGLPADVDVQPQTLVDGDGRRASLIVRWLDFFDAQTWLLTPAGPRRLGLPPKAEVEGLVDGRLLVRLNQNWAAGGAVFVEGSLVSIELAKAMAEPGRLRPTRVYAPGPRDALGQVAATRSALILTALDNVRGRAFVYRPQPDGGWSRQRLDLPDDVAVAIADTDPRSQRALLSVTGFLTPTTLWLADANRAAAAPIKALPPRFDSTKDTVEQFQATSSDGTRIPYFVVRPKAMKLDGDNPTILYGYGGFQVSETPVYSPSLGKLWLERGGVYVLADIRGGGEFGPAWHDAGLKTRRQRVFDDFAAVARDLIARKITSPRRLGIEGGSNGGLLMGVSMTQHPELWNAADLQAPLLDMLRYESIAAGKSWTGEYGDVANPDERAFLASISPYQHLKPGVAYPQALIWTTTKDDRVGPGHARKFAARLAQLGDPYFFYEAAEGGHQADANLEERAHLIALEMIYFIRKLMD